MQTSNLAKQKREYTELLKQFKALERKYAQECGKQNGNSELRGLRLSLEAAEKEIKKMAWGIKYLKQEWSTEQQKLKDQKDYNLKLEWKLL